MRNWVKTAIGSVTAAFLLAGCAGAASGNDGAATSGTTPSATTERQTFPLDEYLDAVFGTDFSNEAQAQRNEQNWQRQQELITQCMHNLGFEYDPHNLPWGAGGGGASYSFDRHPYDREWIAQFGYGVVLQDELMTRIWSTPGFDPDRSGPAAPVEHGLTESELEAFRVALSGPRGDHGIHGLILDDEMSLEDMLRQQGCSGQAVLQVISEGPSGLTQSAEFAPLFEAIDQMRDDLQLNTAPEEIDWAACMADNGHPGFERRTNTDWNAWSSYPEDQIRVARDRILGESRWRSLAAPENTPELAELLELEISMALADYDCRVAVNFEARQTARRTAIETQFVNDHRAALEALRDAAEQRG